MTTGTFVAWLMFVPLWAAVFDPSLSTGRPAFEARLNQDGSWSIEGDIERAKELSFDAQFRCVVGQLWAISPPNNPASDNTAPMTEERMKEIVCADPIAAPCFCPAAVS